MFEKLMNLIQSKTRDEWVDVLKDKWVSLRIWAQENGEYAFVFGVCFGFGFLVLYKLFFLLLALGFIAGFVVYHLAPVDLEELSTFSEELREESDSVSASPSDNGSRNDYNGSTSELNDRLP